MSNPQKKYPIIPETVFWEFVNEGMGYTGFIQHADGRCSFALPEVVISTDKTMSMGIRSHFKLTPQIKHNLCAVPIAPADATRVYMPPPIPRKKRWSPSPDDPDPIVGIDRSTVQNATHLVKKGETLEMLAEKYAISEKDLLQINNNRQPEEGRYYNIFPEVHFTNNPYGGYPNKDLDGGIIYESTSLAELVIDFIIGGDGTCGARLNNMIVTGGAREQIKNWDVVIDLVEEGIAELNEINFTPGSKFSKQKQIEGLASYTGNAIWQNLKKELGFKNNVEDFFSPVHFIGSFNFSMRVNPDGRTATVAVYDSKSVGSMLDNKFGKIDKSEGRALTTTYQRYIWTVTLKRE